MKKRLISLTVAFVFLFSNIAFASVKKDESVYVVLSANGKKKDVVVSDWISTDKEEDIKDKSILKSIVNVKGEEIPEVDGENLVWRTNQKDIFYQGTTDKKLPIDVNISYYLNNSKIEPQKLAGKSGKIKIHITFENKDRHDININGVEKEIYTPFTVLTVLNLPMNIFSNIKVSSGQVFSDGNNQVITFVSMPGLKESLGFKEGLIEIPDSITIEADANNFKLGPIMITTTPNMIDLSKIQGADNIKELIDGIEEIKDATEKLNEGTKKLSGGAVMITENTKKLSDGLSNVIAGTEEIKKGQIQVSEGISKSLDAIRQLKEAKEKENAAYEMLVKGIDGLKGIVSILSQIPGTANICDKLNNGLDQQKGALEKLIEGGKQYIAAIDALQSGMQSIKDGTEKLNTSLGSLQDGQKALLDGSNKLYEGSEELSKGAKELDQNFTKFKVEGIYKMDAEVNSNFGNIDEVLKRKDEIVKLSKNYGTFSGLPSDMEGSVKFIMRTEEIKAPEITEVQSNTAVKENNNIFDKFLEFIRNIF